ncbi:MAG: MFS transporter [Rhodothermaceae bacterium]|nr:MFS transporter [Rhodothermaceae bacterium]
MIDTPGQKNKMGWVTLSALGAAQICSWGTLYYSFPQVAVAMEADLGWLKSEIYGALTLGLLCSAIAALPIGFLIDRGYGRFVMMGGSALGGLLLIGWSQAQTLFWYYVTLAGIGAMQSATLYHAAFAVIAIHYNKRKTAEYITTLTLWGGFASTTFIPVIELLLSHTDWRSVLIVLGLINLLICTALYAMVPTIREAPKEKSSKKAAGYSLGWVIRQPIFWVLLISFSLYSTAISAFGFHLYPILIEKGLALESVIILLAVIGPSQVLGRLIIRFVGVTSTITKIGIFVTLVFPAVFGAFAFLPAQFTLLIPVVVVYGAAKGIMTIVSGMAVPELITKNAYGAINGAMNLPILSLKAFAPTIAALLWTVTQDYNVLMISLLVVSLITVVFFTTASLMGNRAR